MVWQRTRRVPGALTLRFEAERGDDIEIWAVFPDSELVVSIYIKALTSGHPKQSTEKVQCFYAIAKREQLYNGDAFQHCGYLGPEIYQSLAEANQVARHALQVCNSARKTIHEENRDSSESPYKGTVIIRHKTRYAVSFTVEQLEAKYAEQESNLPGDRSAGKHKQLCRDDLETLEGDLMDEASQSDDSNNSGPQNRPVPMPTTKTPTVAKSTIKPIKGRKRK